MPLDSGINDSGSKPLFRLPVCGRFSLKSCYHLNFEAYNGLAAFFYFFPSLGYVLFDICTFGVPSFGAVPSNAFTVTMATLLLIDSLFFLAGLYLYDRILFIFWSVEVWGELTNVLGSVFFIASQGLYFLTGSDFVSTTEIGWHWAVWYFLAYFTWAVSSVLYLIAYFYERKRGRYLTSGPVHKQPEFWDEALNTFASFGYIGTALYGLIPLSSYVALAVATDDPLTFYDDLQAENFKDQARANLIFDLSWTLGGLVNLAVWWRDGSADFIKQLQQKSDIAEN